MSLLLLLLVDGTLVLVGLKSERVEKGSYATGGAETLPLRFSGNVKLPLTVEDGEKKSSVSKPATVGGLASASIRLASVTSAKGSSMLKGSS